MYMIGHPGFDWCFETQPEPQLKGRKIAQPRGKVLGGSSSINGMIRIRGQGADFDHWRQLGSKVGLRTAVVPYFKRHREIIALGADDFHDGGAASWSVEPPQRVDLANSRCRAPEPKPSRTVWVKPMIFNMTGTGEGVGPYPRHPAQRP